MTIKVKILGENKEKVDEGLGALLDPTLLASIAVGLGVGIPFLQSMLGASDRRAIKDMSAQEAAAYVDNVVYGSKAKADAARKEREAAQKRREKELERLKAARDAKKSEEAPEQEDLLMGIEMQPGGEESAEPTPEAIELYSNIVRKVRGNFNIKNQAEYDSLDTGTKSEIDQAISSYTSRIKKLKYKKNDELIPYDERELKRLAKESGQIYEIFKRFL